MDRYIIRIGTKDMVNNFKAIVSFMDEVILTNIALIMKEEIYDSDTINYLKISRTHLLEFDAFIQSFKGHEYFDLSKRIDKFIKVYE